MVRNYLRRFGLVVVAAGLAGALTAVAPGKTQSATPASLHAEFESAVNFAGSTDCPVSSGALLVEGRGIGTGTFGKFDRAIGSAAECSAGVFGGPPPQLGDCHNVPLGAPFFDVHGKGTYVTKDGSVLYLVYHELSENPFIFGSPPFELHDCGVWDVDPNLSTGRFHGATGHGAITATVPVRADFSAHVSADYGGAITLVDGAKASAGPGSTTCTGAMSGPITGNVTVEEGQSCDLEAASVNGNVTVKQGARLLVQYSVVAGNVDCDGCAAANVLFSTALGSLHIDNVAAGSSIFGSVVDGNLVVNNSGPGVFVIQSNYSVGGNLSFNDNTGSSTIMFNTIGGNLDCHGNTPSPVSSGNTADDFKGQCAP